MASLPNSSSIGALVARQVATRGSEPAIMARGKQALTHADLLALMERTAAALDRFGLERGDRVGVVMPNGSEMATLCLSVAAARTCVPFNPDYTEAELDALVRRLGVSTVLVAGEQVAARSVASSLSLPVIDVVVPEGGAAGAFELAVGSWGADGGTLTPEAGDTSLVLHTSGSTAEPKIVPLSHRNLTASAENVARSLGLDSDDVCLSTMPLFHVGALVDLLLAPLSAGGAVAVGGDMGAAEFFACLGELRPTWYQGVPTMLQDVLRHADLHGLNTRGTGLRFIRSVSAPLPEPLLHELEERFDVPVIEIYGMTETAGVITSNPMPPVARRPGSVGVPVGPQVAVVDAAGNAVAPRSRGEIVVRGPNVMGGYEQEPGVVQGGFAGGWLRTGDEGYVDADGYLYLTGRIKDIINRGGEKVSPREIDDVAVSHPDISEAAAFAVPHATLGEEVALAVVPRAGGAVDLEDLRRFCAERLARFKVPRVIHVCDSLPRAPGGKLQRGRLEEWCTSDRHHETGRGQPVTERQRLLVDVWGEVLGVTEVGVNDDFVDLGGDSLRAVELAVRMSEELGFEVPAAAVYDNPTIAELDGAFDALSPSHPDAVAVEVTAAQGRDTTGEAAMLSEVREIVGTWEGLRPREDSLLVGWNTMGSRPPLFWGVQGLPELRQLATALGPDQPVWGMRSLYETRNKSPENSLALAKQYRAEVERVQPEGSVRLAGYCAGGAIALEVARLLRGGGREVASLTLVEHFQARPYDGRVTYLFAVESGWHPFTTLDARWLRLCTGGPIALHPSRATHVDMLADPDVIEALRRELQVAGRPRVGGLPSDLVLEVDAATPRCLVSRRRVRVPVDVSNPGRSAWPVGTMLFARWSRPGYGRTLFDGAVELSTALAPGGRETVELEIGAPLAPGPWRLSVQAVYGGDWSARGIATPFRRLVTVLPGPAVWSYVRERLPGPSKLTIALRRSTGRTA